MPRAPRWTGAGARGGSTGVHPPPSEAAAPGAAADPCGTHHFANLDGRHVRTACVHPGAHRRIDGQVLHLHEEFTVGRTRHRLLGERPVGWLGPGDGERSPTTMAV